MNRHGNSLTGCPWEAFPPVIRMKMRSFSIVSDDDERMRCKYCFNIEQTLFNDQREREKKKEKKQWPMFVRRIFRFVEVHGTHLVFVMIWTHTHTRGNQQAAARDIFLEMIRSLIVEKSVHFDAVIVIIRYWTTTTSADYFSSCVFFFRCCYSSFSCLWFRRRSISFKSKRISRSINRSFTFHVRMNY